MRQTVRAVIVTVLLLSSLTLAVPVSADCPGNLLTNPGFEGATYKSETMGTSLSSNIGQGWIPWSVLGDATYNREVEYKVLIASMLPSRYHIHSGDHAQKYFTTWGTHTAGFYQRVQVTPGAKVTFSIWVQIYTGERELKYGDDFISDLDWPKEPGDKRGPGVYKVYAGIDPYGATPAAFGAPPSENTVWSAPITDFETRTKDANGKDIDAWVLLTVSTIAQGDYVTVYAKGQPEYPVKHNDSFWDDACLIVEKAPTATPKPTEPVTATSVPPTATPLPPTETPIPPTATAIPPTATPEPSATATALPPTVTAVPPTIAPTVAPTTQPPTQAPQLPAVPTSAAKEGGSGLLMLYIGVAVVVIAAAAWLTFGRKH